MADFADIAAQNDFTLESLDKHRRRKIVMAPRGRCLYCDTELSPESIYCDINCRDAHEHEQRMKQRNRT